MFRRREMLLGGGALAGLAKAMRPARAQSEEDWQDEADEDVSFAFDESWLKTYRPLLVTRGVSPTDITGLFAMRVSSPDWDVDVGIYCMEYSTQDGALSPPIGLDEHYGDHEWFYCYVGDDGLEEIAYAAYHWIVGRAEGEDIPTYEDTHPKARVDPRWHNYYLTEEEGSFQDLDNLVDALQGWLDNGMSEHLALETITNPLVMRERESWWQDGLDRWYAKFLYSIGTSGADAVDPVIDS